MASFNGVEIKNYKTIGNGWEGPISSGSVYLNGKRLGTYVDDGSGAPMSYDFDVKQLDEAVEAYNRFEPSNYEDLKWDADCLIGFLENLTQQEKDFKKYVKKGYKTMVVMSAPSLTMSYCTTEERIENILLSDYYKDFCKNFRSFDKQKAKIWFFLSEKDFDLTA